MAGLVGRKYAGALFAVAGEQNLVDAVQEDLHLLRDMMAAAPDLGLMLVHPRIPKAAKRQVLQTSLGADIQPLTFDFLCLLVDKKRGGEIAAVVDGYDELVNAWRNLLPAETITAIPLSEHEVILVADRLRELTGHGIALQQKVDPTIIGGIVIRVGGKLIDASVASQLRRIKEEFLHTKVTHIEVN